MTRGSGHFLFPDAQVVCGLTVNQVFVGSNPTLGALFSGEYLMLNRRELALSLSSSLVANKMMLESDPSKGRFTRFLELIL